MQWLDRLLGLTDWRGLRWERDWAETEAALGLSLPDDYKELCARFGPGSFADYLRLLPSRGPDSLIGWWQSDAEYKNDSEIMGKMFGPDGIYGARSRRGALRWGLADAPEGNFFWLSDAEENPNNWPILAKGEMSYHDKFCRYNMTVSEFVYRVLADGDFVPFAIEESALDRPRTFESNEVYRRNF